VTSSGVIFNHAMKLKVLKSQKIATPKQADWPVAERAKISGC